jgi:hypothetical protein
MGIYGSALDIAKTAKNDFNLSFLNYDTSIHTMYSGIDWVYTYIETIYIYDYKIVYFWLLNSVYDESMDFFFLSVWYTSLQLSTLQLFWSILLDNYMLNTLFQLSFTDEWVRGYMSSKDSALFVIYHPEIIFIKQQLLNNYFFSFLSDMSVSVIQNLETQSLLTPIMLFPQLLFITYLCFVFVSFYFSFYSSSSKEESTVDADYLTASITVESEKEIGSIDDMLMPSVIIVYTFGWYFYLYCWNLFSCVPELVLVFFFFPLLYYTIWNTPTFLLYDFGILFTAYLRGIAPTPTMLFELMYDYIAVIAFYVRILTQGVRLALMFAAYAGMHDFILFMDYNHRYITGNESLWEEISNINTSISSFSYFFLGTLPGILLNWVYEVFHTFFVVTGQLVAYFGMIFWLFLFLFTFFVIEKQENYFEDRRRFRQEFFKKIRNLNK